MLKVINFQEQVILLSILPRNEQEFSGLVARENLIKKKEFTQYSKKKNFLIKKKKEFPNKKKRKEKKKNIQMRTIQRNKLREKMTSE